MIETKDYTVIYIINPETGDLIGEIENQSPSPDLSLDYLSLFRRNGELLRCFTREGFVDTYLIVKDDTHSWPEVRKVSLPERIENN